MANLSVNSSELWMLNKERWILDIGIIIYLGVMMLFGIVGNAFVSYIYYFKLNKTASNLFVAALSFCDLFGCLINIPLDIVVILRPYTFYTDAGCRFIRFLVMDAVVISAGLVFAISVDRFKKIALPLGEQMTRPQVGKICVALGIASTAISLPCFYVYAAQEVTTHRLNVTGMQCTLSSKVKGQLSYIIFVVVIFVTASVALCTIYCLIGMKLYRYKKKRVILQSSNVDIDSCSHVKNKNPNPNSNQNEVNSVLLSPPFLHFPTTEKTQTSFIHMTRTTFIMCLVSFFWIVSFLPHIASIIMLAIKPNLKNMLGHLGPTIIGIGLRSFYFHNAANPWIYSIFNYRFRRELFSLLRKATFR